MIDGRKRASCHALRKNSCRHTPRGMYFHDRRDVLDHVAIAVDDFLFGAHDFSLDVGFLRCISFITKQGLRSRWEGRAEVLPQRRKDAKFGMIVIPTAGAIFLESLAIPRDNGRRPFGFSLFFVHHKIRMRAESPPYLLLCAFAPLREKYPRPIGRVEKKAPSVSTERPLISNLEPLNERA